MSKKTGVPKFVSERADGAVRSKRLDMVLEIPLSAINREDRRFQFRIGSSTVDVQESVRQIGQQVPITLWGREPHVIIDGFRRVHALSTLGHSSVKAILRDELDEHGAFQLSFVENVKRRSWTPFEKALAVRVAIVDRNLSVKQVAAELTLSDRQVQRYLQMAEFDPQLADALVHGRISMAHAALLHRASPENLQTWLSDAERISVESLKKKLRPRRAGRPRSYFSAMDSGFRMSAFRFSPTMTLSEKERLLLALERAADVVRASMSTTSRSVDPCLRRRDIVSPCS